MISVKRAVEYYLELKKRESSLSVDEQLSLAMLETFVNMSIETLSPMLHSIINNIPEKSISDPSNVLGVQPGALYSINDEETKPAFEPLSPKKPDRPTSIQIPMPDELISETEPTEEPLTVDVEEPPAETVSTIAPQQSSEEEALIIEESPPEATIEQFGDAANPPVIGTFEAANPPEAVSDESTDVPEIVLEQPGEQEESTVTPDIEIVETPTSESAQAEVETQINGLFGDMPKTPPEISFSKPAPPPNKSPVPFVRKEPHPKPEIPSVTFGEPVVQATPEIPSVTFGEPEAQAAPEIPSVTFGEPEAQAAPEIPSVTFGEPEAQATPEIPAVAFGEPVAQAAPEIPSITFGEPVVQAAPEIPSVTFGEPEAQATPEIPTVAFGEPVAQAAPEIPSVAFGEPVAQVAPEIPSVTFGEPAAPIIVPLEKKTERTSIPFSPKHTAPAPQETKKPEGGFQLITNENAYEVTEESNSIADSSAVEIGVVQAGEAIQEGVIVEASQVDDANIVSGVAVVEPPAKKSSETVKEIRVEHFFDDVGELPQEIEALTGDIKTAKITPRKTSDMQFAGVVGGKEVASSPYKPAVPIPPAVAEKGVSKPGTVVKSASAGRRKVTVHFDDGSVKRGFIENYDGDADLFTLLENEHDQGGEDLLSFSVKAVFFMKDSNTTNTPPTSGDLIQIEIGGGRPLRGRAVDYKDETKKGFYLYPDAASGSIEKIWVYRAHVTRLDTI